MVTPPEITIRVKLYHGDEEEDPNNHQCILSAILVPDRIGKPNGPAALEEGTDNIHNSFIVLSLTGQLTHDQKEIYLMDAVDFEKDKTIELLHGYTSKVELDQAIRSYNTKYMGIEPKATYHKVVLEDIAHWKQLTQTKKAELAALEDLAAMNSEVELS